MIKGIPLLLFVIIISATNLNKTYAQKVDFKDFNKKEKLKINKMLVFDFFVNFELSVRNEDLSLIYDYIPTLNNTNVKEIILKTNLADVTDDIHFHYNNETNLLEKVDYYLDDLLFKYQFIYDKEKLLTIKVKNKKKYQFAYEKKLLTKVIFYNDQTAEYIFYINYQSKNSATLDAKEVDLGKINHNFHFNKTYIKWNDNFKLLEFELDKYHSKEMKYNNYFNVASFRINHFISGNNLIEWKYTYDNFKNWTERSFDNINITRKIIYKN